jgi:hypothetical protein
MSKWQNGDSKRSATGGEVEIGGIRHAESPKVASEASDFRPACEDSDEYRRGASMNNYSRMPSVRREFPGL